MGLVDGASLAEQIKDGPLPSREAAQYTKKIAEAVSCRTKSVENIRQRLVTDGFEITLNGKKRETPPRQKVLDGEQEAKVIALRLGEPPEGFANWSLRLLAGQVMELGIVDSVSHETLRKTLKKTE